MLTTASRIKILKSEKEKNREKFPQIAKIVDEFTEIFGKVKVLYAEEGGNKVGEKSAEGITTDLMVIETNKEKKNVKGNKNR